MDAVGANHEVARRVAAIGEADRDLPAMLLDGDAARAERDVLIPDGSAQRLVEIRPVHVVERRAPAGDRRVTERHAGEDRAVLPGTQVPRVRGDANGSERFAEPEALQHPNGVGANRQARTNLAENGGLLVDMGIKARLAQGQGGRQPTDPSPGDEDAHDASSLCRSPQHGCLWRECDDGSF